MRITLDEKDLLRLLAGRFIEKQVKTSTVELCLKDMGFSVFQDTLDRAQKGDIRIPCDPGCEASRGHGGACWIGGAPAPHQKGDEIVSRDVVRKEPVTVPTGLEPFRDPEAPPAKPPRRILPPVRRRSREK